MIVASPGALLGQLASLAGVAAAVGFVAAPCGNARADEGPPPQYVKGIADLRESVGGPVIASLMPATPVVVLSKQDTHVEVDVTGWSPMGGARYLFADVGQRISRAILTENGGVDRRVVIGKKDDAWESTWEDVKITGWVEQENVVPDVNTVWEEASVLYSTRCSRCHSLHSSKEFTANQWPSVLKIMTVRAGFSPEQAAMVTSLLQAHGRDQKGGAYVAQQRTHQRLRGQGEPTPAAAAVPTVPAAIPKIVGSPELAAEGGALFESANCVACHGKDAKAPIMPEYPKLAGQNAEYLFKQILDFKNGIRTNDAFSTMKAAVAPLSEADARAIAYWLSIQ